MKHIIAYEGKISVALGLMQEAYVPLYLPASNQRVGIEGTMQRPPYSLAQGIEWVHGLDKTKGKDEVFAILRRKVAHGKVGHEYIGHTGLHRIEWPNGCATTGSMIVLSEARGKGMGTEAKLLLLYHAFMVLGLRKITSDVKAFNTRSAGHLMKCGYQPVGRYRRHLFHEGNFVDKVLFEVFREEWEPVWEQYQKSGALPRLTDDQRSFLNKEMGA